MKNHITQIGCRVQMLCALILPQYNKAGSYQVGSCMHKNLFYIKKGYSITFLFMYNKGL